MISWKWHQHRFITTVTALVVGVAFTATLLAAAAPAAASPGYRQEAMVCYSRRVIARDRAVIVLYGVGRRVGARCVPPELHTKIFAKCLEDVSSSLIESMFTKPLQDCLQSQRPGAAAGGGLLGTGSGGSVGVFWMDLSPSLSSSATCGGHVNPKLASEGGALPPIDAAQKGSEAVEHAKQGAGVFALFKTAIRAKEFQDKLLKEGNGSDGNSAQESKAREDLKTAGEQATQAANYAADVPEGKEQSILGQIWDKITSMFTSDTKKPEQVDGGTTAGGGTGGTSGTRPSTDGESCAEMESFLNECAKEKFGTSPCKLMLTKMNNPKCDPMIALTAGDEPCATERFSAEQLQAAVNRATVQCWSRVRTVDGDATVCGARVGSGGMSFFVMRKQHSNEGCVSTKALTTEEHCAPQVVTPGEMQAHLLPDRRMSITKLVLGLRGGVPTGGPPPK